MSTALVAAFAALTTGSAGGCSQSCGASCGSGIAVRWLPKEVPKAAGYRLCINGTCERVVPARFGDAGEYLEVAPRAATDDRNVNVRLELLDKAGSPTAAYTGNGDTRGDC